MGATSRRAASLAALLAASLLFSARCSSPPEKWDSYDLSVRVFGGLVSSISFSPDGRFIAAGLVETTGRRAFLGTSPPEKSLYGRRPCRRDPRSRRLPDPGDRGLGKRGQLRSRLEQARKNGTLPANLLRWVRTVQVLERIGTPAARDLLERMAQDGGGRLAGREARAALRRLKGKPEIWPAAPVDA